jgi:hypothetical protein
VDGVGVAGDFGADGLDDMVRGITANSLVQSFALWDPRFSSYDWTEGVRAPVSFGCGRGR